MHPYARIGQLSLVQAAQRLAQAQALSRRVPSPLSRLPGTVPTRVEEPISVTDAYLTGETSESDPAVQAAMRIVDEAFKRMASYYANVWRPAQRDAATLPASLNIVSWYRPFAQQANNGAFIGSVLDASGDRGPSGVAAAVRRMLETRAVPGFSRHHWGTDVDVASADRYAWKGAGPFVRLSDFTRFEAPRFGFYTPYWSGRFSDPTHLHYEDEPWHLSYAPIATRLVNAWNTRIRGEAYNALLARGAAAMAPLARIDPGVLLSALSSFDLASYVTNVAPFPTPGEITALRAVSRLRTPITVLDTQLPRFGE